MSFSPALRAEAAATLRLALPLIAAQLIFMGFGVVDTIMAGRLGEQALAAIGVGFNIWMPIFVMFMGVCMAVSPIIAQRVGAGRAPETIGDFLRQALLVAMALGVVWILLIVAIARPLVAQLGLSVEAAQLAVNYLYVESGSAIFFCLCFTQRFAIEGLGDTRPVLVTGLTGFTVKLLVNAALVFGYFGAPRLGVVGAAWGTVAASVVMAATYALQLSRLRKFRELRVFAGSFRVTPEAFEMLRLGLSIGLILLAEAGLFGAAALLMARFGDTMVAAHLVAINFASVMFMVPLGLSLAVTVRVGQAAGADDSADARFRGTVGMRLSLGFALFSALLMGFFPDAIVALYTDDPRVSPVAALFLFYAALFQLFDCLQCTANGALRGIKDTRLPMAITLAAYWLVGMPVAYGLAFSAGYGPNALWWGLTAGLAAAAAGLSWRFLHKTKVLFRENVVMP
jgi:MATE family multidrug resistance protein